MTAYLRRPVRRREAPHIYGVGGHGATQSIVKMQSFSFEDERRIEGAKTELFPLPGGPSGARKGPQKKLWKSEGATKMAASSIHCTFTVSRDHLDGGKTRPKKSFQLKTLF